MWREVWWGVEVNACVGGMRSVGVLRVRALSRSVDVYRLV